MERAEKVRRVIGGHRIRIWQPKFQVAGGKQCGKLSEIWIATEIIRAKGAFRSCLALWFCIAAAQILHAIPPNERLSSLAVAHWGAQSGIPEEMAMCGSRRTLGWFASMAGNHTSFRWEASIARTEPGVAQAIPTQPCSLDKIGTSGRAGSGCIFQIRRDRFGSFANLEVAAVESQALERPVLSVSRLFNAIDGAYAEVARGSGVSRIDARIVDRMSRGVRPPATSGSLETPSIPAPAGIGLGYFSQSGEGTIWALRIADLSADSAIAVAGSSGRVNRKLEPGPICFPRSRFRQVRR